MSNDGKISWIGLGKLGLPMAARIAASGRAPPLEAGDYSSTFSCRQMAKDLNLFVETAHVDAVPAPLAAQLRETYSALIAAGEGDADFISTVPFAARLAGV